MYFYIIFNIFVQTFFIMEIFGIEIFDCEICEKRCYGLLEYGNHRAKYHKITPQQTYNEVVLKGAPAPTCACGCGEEVKFLSVNKGCNILS